MNFGSLTKTESRNLRRAVMEEVEAQSQKAMHENTLERRPSREDYTLAVSLLLRRIDELETERQDLCESILRIDLELEKLNDKGP